MYILEHQKTFDVWSIAMSVFP